MSKEFFFISGLPRSGSTLLSAILKQNPEFYADISSPIEPIVKETIEIITLSENNTTILIEQRINLIKSIFDGFYKNINKKIIFDTNRHWTKHTILLKTLFPYTKIICCVRNITSILDSFERIKSKNCFHSNTMVEQEASHCIETRCKALMDETMSGIVIKPWHLLRDGLLISPDMIHLIEYDELCKNPKQTIKDLYNFIQKPLFNHNFDNIEYKNEEFDRSLNLLDLHTVRKKIEWVERQPILPNCVLSKYKNMEFWRNQKKFLNYE